MAKTVSPVKEATKTTGRVAVLGALSVIVTFLVHRFIPSVPEEVLVAILTLLAVGFDNFQHLAGSRIKVPF